MSQEIAIKLALQGVGAVQTGLKSVESGLGRLGSSLKTVAASAGGLAASLGLGVSVGKLVQVQREFDVLNSSLKTVTGSSAAAEREMAWLKDFAKETPFGLAQATQGFVKMKALGLDPTRAALTSFGNTASAMGKDLNQMIEAVADASTGEFERLKEFGIKAKKEGDNVSLTFQGVTTTIGNSAREITQYLENIGNVSFGGAMEERAKTLDGTIAALGDTWDELFRTVSTNNVGGLIFDSVTLANGALEDATTILRAMGGAAQDASRDTGALSTIQNGIATVFETVAVLGANLKFVLVGIGTEIGGLAAQVAQAAQFNFAGVRAIREQMVADAEAARGEIDATTERILNARKAQEEYARYATRNASAATDPRRVDLGGSTTRAAGGASSGAAKAVKETISEYDKLIKKLSDELPAAAAAAEAAQMGYNKAQTEFLALAASPAWAKFTNDQRATVAALFENKIASEQSADAAKTLAKANLDAAASREKYLTSLSSGLDKIQADIAAQIEATERMGLSKEAIAELDAAKLEMLATDLELQAIKAMDRNLDQQTYDALKKQAAAYRELGIAKKGGAAKEAALEMEKANAEAAKKAQEDWERTSDQINQSLTEALLRGFESGKGFAENLRQTVVNMFKTMVFRPVVSAIVSPISGALLGGMGLSTAAQAGQGGASSGVSTALSGASLLGSVGGSLAAGAGWMTGATTLGGSLSAGMSLLGTGSLAGAGAGLGMLAGALGPIALGIGLLSSAFSRKLKDQGIQGTLGGEAGFEGQQYRFYKGGLFRSDKTTYSAVDPELARVLAGGFSALQNQVTDFAEALSLPTDRIKGFTTDIKVSFKGLDEAGIQKALQDALATGSNELAQQVLGTLTTTTREVTETIAGGMGDWGDSTMQTVTRTIEETTYAASEYAREGEKAIDTLTRLATSLGAVQTSFDALGIAFQDAGLSAAAAASNIVDAFGGLERFTQTLGSYFNNFYSDQEKRAAAARQAAKALSAAGLDVDPFALENATRPAIRAAVDAVIAQFGPGSKQAVAAIEQANLLASVIQQPTVQAATAVADAASEAERDAEAARRAWQQITDGLLAEQDTLQVALLRAQGREGEALAREREIATRGMDDYQRALYDSNAALRNQIDGLQRAAEAARELGELLPSVLTGYGDTAGAQRLQYGHIAGDLVRAGLSGAGAGDLAAALMGMSKDQIAQAALAVYNLTGVTDEMRVALLRAAGSLATLKDEAASAASGGLDAAYSALERAVQARRSVVHETVNDVRAVFDTVRSAARELFGEVDSVVQFNAQAGRAYITQALGAARSTGYLPDGEQLSEAIRAARAGLQGQVFASQAEADYQRLVLANELRELQDISDDQLTEAERQLKALDGILDSARAQIDALRGIDSSVQSVEAALVVFGNAVLAMSVKDASKGSAGAQAGKVGAGMPGWANFGVGDWMVNNGGSLVFDNSTGMLYGQGDVTSHRSELRDAAAALLEAGQNQQLYDAVRGSGFTLDQADAILGLPAGEAEKWARSMGLPIFHDGTPYVPRTGFAVLQQGEAVIPRAFNPFTGGGSSGNAELLAELRALREQNARLEAALERVGTHTGSTATALNSVVRNNALVVDTAPEF